MSEFRRRLLMQSGKKEEDEWCVYKTLEDNTTVLLIQVGDSVEKIELEDGTVYDSSNLSYTYHIFPNKGEHKVKIQFKENADNFTALFLDCVNLVKIPVGMFRKHPNAQYFVQTFENCNNLTNTPKDADGGELWERAGKQGYPSSIDGTGCFTGCSSLPNLDQIPSEWK